MIPGDVTVPFHDWMFPLGFSVNVSVSWESGELAGSYEGPEQGNKGNVSRELETKGERGRDEEMKGRMKVFQVVNKSGKE